MSKHTAEPWSITMRSGYISIIKQPDFNEICNLDSSDLDNGQRVANSRLIAKAPEMFVELKKFAAFIEWHTEIINHGHRVVGFEYDQVVKLIKWIEGNETVQQVEE